MMKKTRITIGLTDEALRMLDSMAERRGLTRPAYLETLVRHGWTVSQIEERKMELALAKEPRFVDPTKEGR